MPKIFNTLDKVRPVYDVIYKIFEFLCKIMLIADIVITAYAVCGRQIGGIELANGNFIRDYVPFLKDPAWTEEVVLSLMCYMAVLSAALAIRRNAHIRMNVFDVYLPKKLIVVLDIVSDLAVMALGVVMLVVGMRYCGNIKFATYISMTWLSKFWMYFPIPLAGFAMIIFEIESIYAHIKSFFVKEDVE